MYLVVNYTFCLICTEHPNTYNQGYNARKVQLRILCVHIETSSLWAEFVNKNGCISVRLVCEEIKSIKILKILIIYIIVVYDQNILLIFDAKDGSHVRLQHRFACLHYRPETIHCHTKDAYTSEITFLLL